MGDEMMKQNAIIWLVLGCGHSIATADAIYKDALLLQRAVWAWRGWERSRAFWRALSGGEPLSVTMAGHDGDVRHD